MKDALPLADYGPSIRVTATVAVAGLLVPGFQVQDTLPPLSVVWVPASALLVDAEPEV